MQIRLICILSKTIHITAKIWKIQILWQNSKLPENCENSNRPKLLIILQKSLFIQFPKSWMWPKKSEAMLDILTAAEAAEELICSNTFICACTAWGARFLVIITKLIYF